MKKRVYICCFKQESNSFCPGIMGMEYFQKNIRAGADLVHPDGRGGQTIRGMVEVLEKYGIEAVGGIGMTAQSGGPISREVVDSFRKRAIGGLAAAGTVDALLLYFHGATISEDSDDVCGELLTAFRGVVGEEMPIAVACDMHANVTAQVLRQVDLICGYQTYPHVDFYETGIRAAELLCRKLEGETLKTASVSIPMVAPASGYTTKDPGLAALHSRADDMVRNGTICDYTFFRAQAWLDVPELAAVVVVTAKTAEAAKTATKTLAQGEFLLRKEMLGSTMMTIDDVVQAALRNPEDKPVILADSADSSGAGSRGDSAAPLAAILPYRETMRAAITVADPAAVDKAFALGVGGRGDFLLGGSLAPKLSSPVMVENAVVRSLHDGRYIAEGPAERGMTFSIGPCAVLEAGKIQILVIRSGQTERDIQFFRGFGIEPAYCRLVSVKACTSFRVSYEPIAAAIYAAATPGSAGHVLTELPYERLPVPLYPFQEITESDIGEPVCRR